MEPSIFKTCFSASLILPKALAAWLVILKWRLKQRRERECFLVLLQVAKHCQQIQGLSGLRFSFFFFLPFTTLWMDLERTRLSEINQTEKDKYLMLSLVFGI